MAAQGLQLIRLNNQRIVAPRPTRCRHCGTVAAELICHICKRSKIENDGALDRAAEPEHGDLTPARDMIIALAVVAAIWFAGLALAVAAMLYAPNANAGEQLRLEVLAGQCEAERLPDGGWWSAHYPHAFDLRSDCYQLSVSEIFTQRAGWDLGMRVGHVDMGRMYVRAIWWLRDEDFHRKPDGHSCDTSTMKDCLGRGSLWQKVEGFTLGGLAERQVLPLLRLGVEGGFFVYEGSFQVAVQPYPHPDTYRGWTSHVYRGWQLSPYLGATVNSGYFMLSARVYTIIRAAEHGCGGCSGPTKGPATQIAAGLQIPF